MGQWGVYDDENDTIADTWIAVEKAILPKSIQESSDDIFEQNNKRREYAIDNHTKVYNQVKKEIKYFKQNVDEWTYMHIAGIILKTCRTLLKLKASDPLGSGIFDSGIPKTFPKGFPDELRNMALDSVKKQIAVFDGETAEWKNNKERLHALNNELIYFSKGKEKINIGDYKFKNNWLGKSKKTSRKSKKMTKSRKTSRKSRKSKKTSRKSKRSRKSRKSRNSRNSSRKGPTISATLVKPGTIKKGNDGNIWVVKSFDTKYGKVNRWVKKT